MTYTIECNGKKTTVATCRPDGFFRRPCESASEALKEYAARRGLRVSNVCYDAGTRGEICAEGYLDAAGAFRGHAVATRND